MTFVLASARGNYTLKKFEFYLTLNFSTILFEYGGSDNCIHFKMNRPNLKKVLEENVLNQDYSSPLLDRGTPFLPNVLTSIKFRARVI